MKTPEEEPVEKEVVLTDEEVAEDEETEDGLRPINPKGDLVELVTNLGHNAKTVGLAPARRTYLEYKKGATNAIESLFAGFLGKKKGK